MSKRHTPRPHTHAPANVGELTPHRGAGAARVGDANRPLTLRDLPVHHAAVIRAVRSHLHQPHARGGLAHDHSALRRRLMELGFVPGERVEVLRRMFLGRGPVAVRVGTSTFALRSLESSLVEVEPTR